jgi:hypothetical protein
MPLLSAVACSSELHGSDDRSEGDCAATYMQPSSDEVVVERSIDKTGAMAARFHLQQPNRAQHQRLKITSQRRMHEEIKQKLAAIMATITARAGAGHAAGHGEARHVARCRAASLATASEPIMV